MEELQPEELEGLVQELEGESEEEEASSPEVEDLLRRLVPWSPEQTRRDAAAQLGRVGISSPRIVQALLAASESDPHVEVRRAAAKSLQAPVHQQYLRLSLGGPIEVIACYAFGVGIPLVLIVS